ncbi:MAG TPA: DinB family protein [Gemmatimonadaceae bacterium]|nr:DinB family protein [Gemmatimonadaceae bacterium]
MTTTLSRPEAADYAPYYGRYIEQVPDGDVLRLLEDQISSTLRLLRGIPEERGGHRYAPEKWSIKDVVGHLSDAERIFAYRSLRIARGDETPLPGFDQDPYVTNGNFDRRTLADLASELESVRAATLSLFRGLDAAAFARRGTASGVVFTVRALPYIIAGHERHHVTILRSRYLG